MVYYELEINLHYLFYLSRYLIGVELEKRFNNFFLFKLSKDYNTLIIIKLNRHDEVGCEFF
jgi:hypothetical protein